MRLTGIITGLMIAVWASPASAASPLTPAEVTVCKSVKYCVDIIRRHAPDEYDYAVLHDEFVRFGDKGKVALLNMLSGKDETDMRRAQDLLAKGRLRFTPDEQRTIAAMWPRGDLDIHATIMFRAFSPLMQARMIDTLSYEDSEVRRISRDIITAAVLARIDFRPNPDDFSKLSHAALTEPAPALVDLLATFDPVKTMPVFKRLLRSGDGLSVTAAYQKLYEQDQKAAFETLLKTLYDLKDTEAEAAFALSDLLQERHRDRDDGFYLNFAKDIAQDPEMSVMGRVAGFDAVMRHDKLLTEPFEDTPLLRETLEIAVRSSKTHSLLYYENLVPLVKKSPDEWLNILRTELKDPLDATLLKLASVTPSKTAKELASQALAHKTNYHIIAMGAELAALQNDRRVIPLLMSLRDKHPLSHVRYAATQALKSLRGDAVEHFHPNFSGDGLKTINESSFYCTVNATDFKKRVERMPYFGAHTFEGEPNSVNRSLVTTTYPTRSGWLVGYDKGEWSGALIYFDGLTDERLIISHQAGFNYWDRNIKAIIPVTTPKLGEFADDFWVITGLSHLISSRGAIYRVKFDGQSFTSRLHARLPSMPQQIEHRDDNSIIFGFHYRADMDYVKRNNNRLLDRILFNPPLLLSSDGRLTRACEDATRSLNNQKKASP